MNQNTQRQFDASLLGTARADDQMQQVLDDIEFTFAHPGIRKSWAAPKDVPGALEVEADDRGPAFDQLT